MTENTKARISKASRHPMSAGAMAGSLGAILLTLLSTTTFKLEASNGERQGKCTESINDGLSAVGHVGRFQARFLP